MKKIILLLFFMILLLSFSAVRVKGATSTKMYIDPPSIINPGGAGGDNRIAFNVRIDNVTDLAGYEFKLYWNPNILTFDSADVYAGSVWPASFSWKNEHNDTGGYYYLSYTKMNTVDSFTGNTYLALIYLRVINEGTSSLDLRETKLGNSNALPINHEVGGGIVLIKPLPTGGGGGRMPLMMGTTEVLNSPFVIVATIVVILIILVTIFSSLKMIGKKRKIR
jgi:hypothetical protein